MTIKDCKELKNSITAGINTIADTVAVTLGPKGGNVLLYNNNGIAFSTKDGISVAKKIVSTDPIEEAAIHIMREASAKTADLAGDGTTTTLVLAKACYNKGMEMLEKGISLNSVRGVFERDTDRFTDALVGIFSKAVSFEESTIRYIATTSANNDEVVGNLVTKAFMKAGPNGSVKFDMEQTPLSYIESFEGSRYDIGTIAKEFFTSLRKQEADYESCNVLCLNSDIKTIEDIKSAAVLSIKQSRPLVIFATAYAEKAMEQIFTNNVKAGARILPINVTGNSLNRKDVLNDIAVLTGTTVYDCVPKNIDNLKLGYCNRVIASLFNTLIAAEPNDNTKILIDNLKEMLDNEKDLGIKKLIEKRISSLKGNLSIVHVGGTTDVEAKERYDRVEDAVCAVKASLEEGISEGGGFTFLKIARFLDISGGSVLKSVFEAPFRKLCENSGIESSKVEAFIDSFYSDYLKCNGINFLTDTESYLYDTGIIDPTKVVRLSLQNAVSVALQLLSTKAIVTDYKFDPYNYDNNN